MTFDVTIMVLTFFLGIIASFLATMIWEIISIRLPKFSKINNISINGIWIGRPPYLCRPGHDAFNVFRINEKNGKVKLYIEHYNNSVEGIHKLTGIGIFNSPLLSAIYKFMPSFVSQSGTLTMRLKQTGDGITILTGIYSQIVEIEENGTSNLVPISEPYTLHRIRLPLGIQIRTLIGRTFYSSYEEVLKIYGRLCS